MKFKNISLLFTAAVTLSFAALFAGCGNRAAVSENAAADTVSESDDRENSESYEEDSESFEDEPSEVYDYLEFYYEEPGPAEYMDDLAASYSPDENTSCEWAVYGNEVVFTASLPDPEIGWRQLYFDVTDTVDALGAEDRQTLYDALVSDSGVADEIRFTNEILNEDGDCIFDYSIVFPQDEPDSEEFLPEYHFYQDDLLMDTYPSDYQPTWSILWVVVQNLDADAATEDGGMEHMNLSMDDDELDYFLYEVSGDFEQKLEEYTNGWVDFEITPVVYDTVTQLYAEDDWNTIDLSSFSAEDKELFRQYNTVAVTCRYADPDGQSEIYRGWSGVCCGIPEGYGYFIVPIDGPEPYEPGAEFCSDDPEAVISEPWIHEFIHSLEPFGENMDDPIGNPDEAQKYGYEDTDPEHYVWGFYPYYSDDLSGDVWSDERNCFIGMTEAMWKRTAFWYDLFHDGVLDQDGQETEESVYVR